MRNIGKVESETHARVFGHYLVARGIANQVEAGRESGWLIWVEDDNRLEEAEQELERFLANPESPDYKQGAREGKARLEQEAREAARARTRIIDARTTFSRGMPPGIGYVTVILIGISVCVYLIEYFTEFKQIGNLLTVTAVRFVPPNMMDWERGFPEILHGQIWRVITPIFLHGDIIHILFNMMWLRMLGSSVEYVEGSRNFVLQVLLYAVASNMAQYFVSGPAFRGMSGVVYGLFGYVWICSKHDPTRPYQLDKVNVVLMIAWFFACLFGWVGPIANTAHAVGLIGGILLATITVRQIPFTKIRF